MESPESIPFHRYVKDYSHRHENHGVGNVLQLYSPKGLDREDKWLIYSLIFVCAAVLFAFLFRSNSIMDKQQEIYNLQRETSMIDRNLQTEIKADMLRMMGILKDEVNEKLREIYKEVTINQTKLVYIQQEGVYVRPTMRGREDPSVQQPSTSSDTDDQGTEEATGSGT
jgi:hypothetical protein